MRDRLSSSSVPVSIGSGGFVPPLVLGALFAGLGVEVGLPVALAAAVGATLGTASLLVHELGHVRAARRVSGIRPVGVSLVWLGAGARLEGAYRSGRDQMRVAFAGPLFSLLAAGGLVPVLMAPIPVTAKKLLLAVALLNVALALANLIPASPMDGHKIVTGLLWSVLGSEPRARRVLKRAAQAWIAVEVAATAGVLVEKPIFGLMMVVVGASLYGQKFVVRRHSTRA